MKASAALVRALFWSLPLVFTVAAHGDVQLVRDGKPMADIVLAANALSSVKLAAEDLQTHLELMSGARLPIANAPSGSLENHVYVGPSEHTRKLGIIISDLKIGGFKIVAKGSALVLLGRDDQRKPFPFHRKGEGLKEWQEFAGEKYGVPFCAAFIPTKLGILPYDDTATLYAVSQFLEQLGVRWYYPYENGTVIPERKTISVPEQFVTKEPAFPMRQVNFYWTMLYDPEGMLWFKRLKYGSAFSVLISHATANIITREQREEHPEYFAVIDGKMVYRPRLCEPGFRKSTVNFLRKTLEAYPSYRAVNAMPTDGFTEIDERDAKLWSRPGRGYLGKFSDYVWDYWLYVADALRKSHPDRFLVAVSYAPYAEPPSQIDKLPDNVAVCIAQNTAASFLPQFNIDRLRAKWLSMLTSKGMYIYDYYLFYRTEQSPRYPVVFTKHLQADMQKLHGVCWGKNAEVAAARDNQGRARLACPGLTHLLHYVQGKLYWDPDLDLQALLDEYYALYFGPAKTEMKEFYEFAEEVWTRPKSRSTAGGGHGFLQAEDVDRYFEILERARQKAGADTIFDKRIAQIEAEMQPLKLLPVGMKRSGPDFQVYTSREPVTIDGDLKEPFWTGQKWWRWYAMRDLVTGEALDKNRTKVAFRIAADRSSLAIAVVCDESKMDSLHAKAEGADDFDIFNDDVIEVYIETPERSYFKIVVNTEAKIWDETQDVTLVARDTLPTLWNPGTRAAVKKEDNRWTLELLIPTKDFGSLGPTKDYPWGVNVCRARRAGGEPECSAIAPTGEMFFARVPKWGNLRAR